VRAAYADLGVPAEIAPFFDDMPARMAEAQLVIAAPAPPPWPILAVIGRPAILIPYAAAMDDHQTANAAPGRGRRRGSVMAEAG
jgi:UDP-N-acetylglucosamine--N-acetylmuramyl-(pentapeptide) pyrophosphoryl-undecaprenol N-acetylglucosamine transferase